MTDDSISDITPDPKKQMQLMKIELVLVEILNGAKPTDACEKHGISTKTLYRYQQAYPQIGNKILQAHDDLIREKLANIVGIRTDLLEAIMKKFAEVDLEKMSLKETLALQKQFASMYSDITKNTSSGMTTYVPPEPEGKDSKAISADFLTNSPALKKVTFEFQEEIIQKADVIEGEIKKESD